MNRQAERLQKVLAMAGLGSRRNMEELISSGRVKLNGKTAQLGQKVTANDKLQVDNRVINNPLAKKVSTKVLLYHKPMGEVCTRSDEKDRKTVFSQIPKLSHGRWIMVGRLDLNTSGLLLFTNNGELANRLMHPRHEIEREYAVRVLGKVSDSALKALKKGVMLEDGMASFDSIHYAGGHGINHWYHVVLKEGRNREVRRLFSHQNYTVSRLIRVRYAHLLLPRHLRRGLYQELAPEDILSLMHLVGL